MVLPATALALLIVGFFGLLYWLDQTLYVFTDNAQVTGALVQIGSPGAGQVRTISVEVGDQVVRHQVLGTVALSSSPNAAQVQVRSPIEGVVVAIPASAGDVLAAGRPIMTLVDPANLWVQAQIDETRVGRVRPGQPVEVTVDSLGRVLAGRVAAIGTASAAALSPSSQPNPSVYFVKVPQLVPVKIEVDYGGEPLVVGGSVAVKIRVQE